ncbi:hypothetical protein EMIT0196P_20054 [Pseudomonas chlororaphis]
MLRGRLWQRSAGRGEGKSSSCRDPASARSRPRRRPSQSRMSPSSWLPSRPGASCSACWCATRKFRGSAYSSSFVGGFDYCLGALQNNLNLHPRMFREIGIGHCGSSSRQGFRGGTERTVQGSLSTSRALEPLSSFNRKKCYAKGPAMGCGNPSRKSLVMPTRSLQQHIEWTCS